MVKLILPNSAPPGLQVGPKLTKFFYEREVMKSDREVTKSVALFSRHFWLSWPGGAELGKMSFTIDFVYENYNF